MQFPLAKCGAERLTDDAALYRFEDLADDWLEEGATASVAGNPRRGDYLEHMSQRLRRAAPAIIENADRRVAAQRLAEDKAPEIPTGLVLPGDKP